MSAPAKAASGSAAKLPARKEKAITAPSPAPALTPTMCGSPSGLRSADCSITPATARLPPTTAASSARGRRKSMITVRLSVSPPPRSTSRISAGEMLTEPRPTANTSAPSSTRAAPTSQARKAPRGRLGGARRGAAVAVATVSCTYFL